VDPGPAPDRYQTVFVTEVIEHLPADQGAALLSRLHDSLRPGGHAVVSVPSGENLLLSSRYCPTCRHLFHPWGHVRSFVADTLRRELENAGFVIDAVFDVDFSAARETIESTKSLRVELGRWSQRLAQLNEQPDAAPLAALISEFRQWAASQSLPEPDAQGGRHIGQGGTLVAIARRR
jgi:SAM-dependent methyltransferase